MREILLKIFSENNTGLEITLFSIWHILYILIIVTSAICAGAYLVKKSKETQNRVLDVIACLIPMLYVLDFFLMPLARSSHDIDIDKLPFHLCTLMGVLIPFTRFNKKFEKIKTPVTCLGLVGAIMYITYPGSAVGGVSPFCYRVVQTFLYHGLLIVYGYLNIATDSIELDFKKIYKELCIILGLVVWASLGTSIYSNELHHYDWFFVTGSTFPFVPKWLMPFAVIAAVFAMCAIIYYLNILVRKTILNIKKSKV